MPLPIYPWHLCDSLKGVSSRSISYHDDIDDIRDHHDDMYQLHVLAYDDGDDDDEIRDGGADAVFHNRWLLQGWLRQELDLACLYRGCGDNDVGVPLLVPGGGQQRQPRREHI